MPSPTKKSKLKKRSKRPSADDYQIVVRWSEEDECFLAYAPALEGCLTHGDTPEDALKEGRIAAQLWLDSAYKHTHPIPKPTGSYSGRMTLRMPVSLHRRIAEEAEREGVSINQWVVIKLAG